MARGVGGKPRNQVIVIHESIGKREVRSDTLLFKTFLSLVKKQ